MSKKKLATVWLDGCSGCHMSFLDMDERLLTVAGMADLVYSPLVDAKEFPADVDVTLVEGAVSSEEDLRKIKIVRERTKIIWFRWATARSRPTCRACAIPSALRRFATGRIARM